MILAAHESVFSIPLRTRWSTEFSDELKPVEPNGTTRIGGLDRFVADETNLSLRIFADPFPLSVLLGKFDHLWPLTLFGASGTGKTSLALTLLADVSADEPNDSSGNVSSILSLNRRAKAVAMTAADFDRRFRSSLGSDLAQEFRKKIVRSSGLLIDGLQYLENKPAAQQELVQIVDQLGAAQRPVIFTLERPPQDYDGLVPQLVSRLTGGLLLPVNEPGPFARAVIIRELGLVHKLPLSDSSIALLAERLNTSVPKIVLFFGQLRTAIQMERRANKQTDIDKPIEPSFINRLFHRSPEDEERFVKAIIQAVAAEFKVKNKDLVSNSRKHTIVFARAVAVYLLRRHLALSFLKIGMLFGNRDHSTIMHAYRKIETLISDLGGSKSVPQNQIADKNKIIELERSLANRLASDIKFQI
jgi:chromosomal replication initiator protein